MGKKVYTADDILKDMKNGVYYPVYLLMGDEEYYIDLISNYAKDNILCEDDKEFNLNVLYGQDVKCDQIVMLAKQYPLMADHQVIIVREAQNIKDFSSLSKYMPYALSSSIVVLCHKHGKVDGRSKVTKDIEKYGGVVFESKPLYDSQVPAWIMQYVGNMGYKIEPKAASLMAEFIGANLSKVTRELAKLKVVLEAKHSNMITCDLIEDNIGVSKDYNDFELINAIVDRNEAKVNRIINYFAENGTKNPIVRTISNLFDYFTKLMIYHYLLPTNISDDSMAQEIGVHKFFLKDYKKAASHIRSGKTLEIIALLRELDAKSKGYRVGPNVDSKDLMREYMYKIMH